MSKQCLSYLTYKVLRLPFHHSLLLLDQTMYVASLMEGVSAAATRGQQCMQTRFPPWTLSVDSPTCMPAVKQRYAWNKGPR